MAPNGPPNRFANEQARRNLEGKEHWEAFKGHRAQICARLLRAAQPSTVLAVFGAGNSNDLDLAKLSRTFAEVHLVDIDSVALEQGARRQLGATMSAVQLHGGIDLTDSWNAMTRWSPDKPTTDEEINGTLERVNNAAPAIGGPFGTVASTCIVSQLIEAAVSALGQQHPRLVEVALAIRTAHIRLLCESLAPGGHAILITDFVSSETLPELLDPAEPEWPVLLQRIVSSSNFFTGLNPFALLAFFRSQEWLARLTTSAEITGFWRWHLPTKTFAVCALEFRRRAREESDPVRIAVL